jgi:hypothetical protein
MLATVRNKRPEDPIQKRPAEFLQLAKVETAVKHRSPNGNGLKVLTFSAFGFSTGQERHVPF